VDLKTILGILKTNELSKLSEIHEGKTVKELVSELYSDVLVGKIDAKVKEKIGILYQTKEINPPYFFSDQFKLGIYMPIVMPLVLPFLVQVFGYVKAKMRR